ncbi:unnamed protein product [Ilex paraguariensis]|uniref:Myb/SANT-like DNA-binding domain-containing protein n=1 Tax=Ilex paraguariensis TaxID=185542 RepID=A0ABC8SC19_9AQUA
MGEATESSIPKTATSRPLPFREDCWSEEATSTLVDAWGRRYLELNRGNLRQKDWQEVADSVNALHGHTKKTRRTDVQCKNRIDTLKKKYKIEKAKIAESNGVFTSSWPFFLRLDVLIGVGVGVGLGVSSIGSVKQKNVTQTSKHISVAGVSESPILSPPLLPPMALALTYKKMPVTPLVMPQKRPVEAVDDGYFRRNYSAVAAAAAKGVEEEKEEVEEEGDSDESEEEIEGGMRKLAKAIESFGEIYERVEGTKQRQIVELEKQRMQFAKDLEVQRMQLFMDTQVQLEKIKQAKRSGSSDGKSLISIYLSSYTVCDSFRL